MPASVRRHAAVAAVLSLAVLAGCTTADVGRSPMAKAGAGVHQATLDDLECRRTAAQAIETHDTVVGGLADLVRVVVEERARDRAYTDCMVARGYAAPAGS